jgi:hypothetical protein
VRVEQTQMYEEFCSNKMLNRWKHGLLALVTEEESEPVRCIFPLHSHKKQENQKHTVVSYDLCQCPAKQALNHRHKNGMDGPGSRGRQMVPLKSWD